MPSVLVNCDGDKILVNCAGDKVLVDAPCSLCVCIPESFNIGYQWRHVTDGGSTAWTPATLEVLAGSFYQDGDDCATAWFDPFDTGGTFFRLFITDTPSLQSAIQYGGVEGVWNPYPPVTLSTLAQCPDQNHPFSGTATWVENIEGTNVYQMKEITVQVPEVGI